MRVNLQLFLALSLSIAFSACTSSVKMAKPQASYEGRYKVNMNLKYVDVEGRDWVKEYDYDFLIKKSQNSKYEFCFRLQHCAPYRFSQLYTIDREGRILDDSEVVVGEFDTANGFILKKSIHIKSTNGTQKMEERIYKGSRI